MHAYVIARCIRSDAVRIAEGDGDELQGEHHLGTGEVERPAHVYGRSETDTETHTQSTTQPTQPYTHILSAPPTRTHHTHHTRESARTVDVHAIKVRGGHVAERPHKHQHVRLVARRELHQRVGDEGGAE